MLSNFNWGQISGISCGLCGMFLGNNEIFGAVVSGIIAFSIIIFITSKEI